MLLLTVAVAAAAATVCAGNDWSGTTFAAGIVVVLVVLLVAECSEGDWCESFAAGSRYHPCWVHSAGSDTALTRSWSDTALQLGEATDLCHLHTCVSEWVSEYIWINWYDMSGKEYISLIPVHVMTQADFSQMTDWFQTYTMTDWCMMHTSLVVCLTAVWHIWSSLMHYTKLPLTTLPCTNCLTENVSYIPEVDDIIPAQSMSQSTQFQVIFHIHIKTSIAIKGQLWAIFDDRMCIHEHMKLTADTIMYT